MIREKTPLLEINFTKKKSSIIEFFNNIIESFYDLFELIMENPIESFWYECLNIFLGYIQLICYILDPTVSN
jgi:hypothetical protein